MEALVTVSHISWITQPYGHVKPYLHFNVIRDPITNQDFHTVMGQSALFIQENKIGMGTKIKIILPEKDEIPIPRLKEVIQLTDLEIDSDGELKLYKDTLNLPFLLPTCCRACYSKLVWKKEDLFCDSFHCPVKERTLISRFLSYLDRNALTDEQILSWLNAFPIQGGLCLVEINDIREFIQQFKQAGPKASRNRLEILKRYFLGILLGKGELGELLHELELEIENKLEGGITYEEFWYIQNLPGIGKEEAKLLAGFNPLASTPIHLSGLDEELQVILAIYQDRWIPLAQFWNSRYKLID